MTQEVCEGIIRQALPPGDGRSDAQAPEKGLN